jgi:hypothetical protein
MLEADHWDRVLANVKGTIVRGTERVSSNRLLDELGVGPDPAIRQKLRKRLVEAMRRRGWHGPRPMRISGEEGHAPGCSGYWRTPSRPKQPALPVEGEVDAPVEGEVDGLSDDPADALEQVTRQGLRKLSRVLRVPLDATDASLTRNQITAAGIAINAQLRADEQRLRAKVQGDVLGRLLAEIEKVRRERAAEEAAAHEGRAESVAALGKPPEDAGEAS